MFGITGEAQMSGRPSFQDKVLGSTYLSTTPIVSQQQLDAFKPLSREAYIQQGQLPPEILEYVRRDMLNYVKNEVPKTEKQTMAGTRLTAPQRSTREVYVPGLDKPIFVQYDNYGNKLEQLSFRSDDYGSAYEFKPNTGALRSQGAVIKGGGILSDLGPIALAALGANFLAPAAAGAAGAGAGAAGGAALSPYAAQAAGAYGGSAAAAQAAAAGSLAGIQQAGAAQNALSLGIPTSGGAVPNQVAGMSTDQISPLTPDIAGNADKAALYGTEGYGAAATPAELAAATGGTSLLDSLGGVGTAILDFAKANPSIAGSLLGAVTGAIGAANAPKAATTQSNIDPQLRAEYLANIERAKQTAADLGVRQFAEPGAMYTGAEQKLYNLGMTPFGAADIERFYNPYQEQVVQGALGDIERTRQMQEQANMEQATRARAFGGSRQGVVSGMTNEAALRQAATTGAQLRSAGFNTAANLGMAARPLDIAGLRTSLDLGTARTALEQARLDALRNLGTERLAITSGSLGIGIPNIGGSTSQPLYSNVAGSALSGGLTGSYIGSLLDPNRNKQTA
jgi:hypothetical protein